MAEHNRATEQASEKLTVKLAKPYSFEGTEYNEVDLSGLEKLTVRDAVKIQLELFAQQEMAATILCETTTAFARAVATRASGLPAEFFKLMPRGVWRSVKQAVSGYFNGALSEEGNYLTFDAPYSYNGKSYEGVELSGVGSLTTMDESRAENRLTREGFLITETSGNYLFACALASYATGLDEAFFTGLPIRETLKLKNAVNNAGFFE